MVEGKDQDRHFFRSIFGFLQVTLIIFFLSFRNSDQKDDLPSGNNKDIKRKSRGEGEVTRERERRRGTGSREVAVRSTEKRDRILEMIVIISIEHVMIIGLENRCCCGRSSKTFGLDSFSLCLPTHSAILFSSPSFAAALSRSNTRLLSLNQVSSLTNSSQIGSEAFSRLLAAVCFSVLLPFSYNFSLKDLDQLQPQGRQKEE